MGKFKAAMTDMTIIMSLWAGDMTWLDGGEGGCGAGGCNLAGTSATISNMKLTGSGGGGGGDSTKFNCDSANKVCLESDTGSSSYNDCYASCIGGVTPPSNVVWGKDCANKDDGVCGENCGQCTWSWPSNESWDGPDAKCRC